MPTQVKSVLVASHVANGSDDAGTPCNALQHLVGKCSLTLWLETLESCPRLQPLADKVIVVCHQAHHHQVASWAAAAGLPSSCVISSSGSSLGLLQGVSAALAACPSLSGCYLLAADCSYVLEAGSSLCTLVEAAVTRGKDTISIIVPFEGADLSQLVQVVKEEPAADKSRIMNIQAAGDGIADGCTHTTMGPVIALTPATAADLAAVEAAAAAATAAAPAGSCADGLQGIGFSLQQLLDQGKQMYSIDIPFYFTLSTSEDAALTDAFFHHYQELQRIATREVQHLSVGVDGIAAAHITGTLDSLMGKLQTLGARQPPSATRQQLQAAMRPMTHTGSPSATASAGLLLTGPSAFSSSSQSGCGGEGSSLKYMFAEFYNKYQEQRARASKLPVNRDYASLPARFEHPDTWALKTKQQHPCYLTTNNEYGFKRPTGFDMPLVWSGIQGKFTETFHGGCYKSMGLKTSVERSRVHRNLDYL